MIYIFFLNEVHFGEGNGPGGGLALRSEEEGEQKRYGTADTVPDLIGDQHR